MVFRIISREFSRSCPGSMAFAVLFIFFISGLSQNCFSNVAKIYWTDWKNKCVWSANGDGSNKQHIYNVNINSLDGIDFDPVEHKLYIGTSYDLLKSNTDGSSAETLYHGGTAFDVYSVSVDRQNRKVYWSVYDQGNSFKGIRRANLDGTSVETVFTSSGAVPYNIDFNPASNKFYWAQTDGIYRADMDGSNRQLVLANTFNRGHMGGLALDISHNNLYFSTWEGGGIWTAKLDGSNPKLILPYEATASLRLDAFAEKLYWITNGSISCSNLDGTSRRGVCGFSGSSNSLALETIPEPATMVLLGLGGIFLRSRKS